MFLGTCFVFTLAILVFHETAGFSIRNELLVPVDGAVAPIITEIDPGTDLSHLPETTTAPQGPTRTFLNREYGFGWRVTMLVLSSLTLLLGTGMLILNIHQNRKKRKVLCVLKSYTPMGVASQPGSPVPSERARLMQHSMPPARSPSLQRGEILIEWKDGTSTLLFNHRCLAD